MYDADFLWGAILPALVCSVVFTRCGIDCQSNAYQNLTCTEACQKRGQEIVDIVEYGDHPRCVCDRDTLWYDPRMRSATWQEMSSADE